MVQEVMEMARKPTSVTLPKEFVEWLDQKVASRVYANRSHAIEALILEAMKATEENKGKIKLL